MTRPALIFLHISKTAGTATRELLRRRFEPAETYVQPPANPARERAYLDALREDPPPWARPATRDPDLAYAAELSAMPAARRAQLRLLLGHFWFGVHELLPGPATYVTLLRDPVDRVLSLFHHRVAHQGLDVTLEDYVRAARDFDIDNGQTRRLAGISPIGRRDVRWVEPTEGMLRLAQSHLDEHFSVVGVTERFEEFAARLGATFGWADVRVTRLNESRGRPRREDLPPAVVHEIEGRNRLDAELHAAARERA